MVLLERRRKQNANRREARGTNLPAAIALKILEHAELIHDDSTNTHNFPHAASAFAGTRDHSDCPEQVRNLILNHEYRYIVNDISVAQAFADVNKRIYVVKVQQPKGDWVKIYGNAEAAFETLAKYYSLEPHRQGHFKTRNCGVTMGNGSTVR
ncbi:hypothetical protein PILCRDRAFT_91472 [Piloderma croceum F 1598]|uniref:Uncharacterized protein n=1 Tax=Piloderma croceum (strain F 1598) TaxID=765440 RepID=A0A0C3ARY1_PILCF|nr:hypothetical protein PILCRDRAFT_91472 [Piloderma croceum F 1598]